MDINSLKGLLNLIIEDLDDYKHSDGSESNYAYKAITVLLEGIAEEVRYDYDDTIKPQAAIKACHNLLKTANTLKV